MINSRYPLVCATPIHLRIMGSRFFRSYACNLPSSFNIVLSSALYTLPDHLCRFRVRSIMMELFPGTASLPIQSNKNEQVTQSVTTTRPTNINVVPIDYACPPRLRGRLTLLRLTLSRNPCLSARGLSPPLSLLMSTFALPIPPEALTGPPSLAYGTLRYHTSYDVSSASVHGFSPVTFSAQRPLFRPVSCYAFFK